MSKFVKVMVVLLTIAAFAAPAFATDLSISGQMRVEGFYNDQDSKGDATLNWDQRFRINSVFKVSDDVKAVLRVDLGESQWGLRGQDTIRNSVHESWATQIDKAYLQIDKELFSLSAGQQFFGSPNYILVDHVGTGIIFSLKTPVTIKAQFTKMDENGSFVDADIDVAAGGEYKDSDNNPTTAPVWVPAAAKTSNADDTNLYSVDVGYSNDTFSVGGIYGLLDNASTDDNKSALGIYGTLKVAGLAIKAELDILDGDNGAGMDYTGTQFYLDANANIIEALNIGGFFQYVAGDTKDKVIGSLTDWWDFAPNFGGYVSQSIISAMPIAGVNLSDTAGNAGLITAAFYATFQASDDLGLKFQGQYGMEEEDAVADFDYTALTASAKYKVATNTYFMTDVIFEDLSSDSGGDDDNVSFWTQLQVNF